MPDQHSESMPDPALTAWKSAIYVASFITIAFIFFSFRRTIVGAIVSTASYIVWSVNIFGSIIPQPVLWVLLLVLILYIAVGSFYGKRFWDNKIQRKLGPSIGPVEARARWIEERSRGTYFKWRLANLLGRVYQAIQEANRYDKSKDDSVPARVHDYLDAGLNTSFADYSLPKLFQKKEETPLDMDLEEVVDYLEEQLEIKDER
ncbi:MAG: hypothetical protein HZB50_17975 [Chloroflexi bacterium]|nr:hypothetical protein [Chloroflexota bacterium]